MNLKDETKTETNPNITRIATSGGVFFAVFDGNYTDFADEDGDILFSIWGNCTDEKVASQFCKVWNDAFNSGTKFGRLQKQDEIKQALGLN